VKEIETRYQELLAMSKAPLIRQDVHSTYAADRLALQRNEANSISALLVDISSHHDRLVNLSKSKETGMHIDLAGLEGRTEGLTAQVSRMHDSLKRMASTTSEIEARLNRIGNSYNAAAQLLRYLEAFGEEARNKLSGLQQVETSFEEHKAGAKFLQEELSNLVTWYRLFHTAHHELIYEIDRRHKEMRRQQEVVDAYSRELRLMHQTECQKRENFFEFYGRYLPPSLCPHIMEPATRYQIYPDHYSTNLPILSDSIILSMEQLQLLQQQPTTTTTTSTDTPTAIDTGGSKSVS